MSEKNMPRSSRALVASVSSISVVALLVVGLAGRAGAQDHPREIQFPDLDWKPPSAAAHRVVLGNGLVAFLVRDPALPAIRVRAYVRSGSVDDPPGKEGLAALTFATLRSCGIEGMTADKIDARLDALGGSIDAETSATRGVLDAWTLAAGRDEVLALLAGMLARPLFEEDRFEHARDDTSDEAGADEDEAPAVANRRMRRAVYGDHVFSRHRTPTTIAAIEREDVVAFHKAHIVPARTVLAVSGAFEPEAMKKSLERIFGSWGSAGKPEPWKPLAKVPENPAGGIVIVDRPEMTEAYVEIGRAGLLAGTSEEPVLQLADHIFGSGSFTSRVVAKIRADEGLAYSVGSDFETNPVVPGLVRTYFQSQAVEASYALSLAFAEAKRLAESGPTLDELAGAKSAVLGRFPGRFATAGLTAQTFAEAELDGVPESAFTEFRARIERVTAEQVRAAVAKHFDVGRSAIVIVGPAAKVRRSPARGTKLEDLAPVRVEAAPK